MITNPLLTSMLPKLANIFIIPSLKEHDYINLRACKLCGLLAKTLCGRCGTCYCSKFCQYAHLEQHQMECISLPGLEQHPSLYACDNPYMGAELPVLVDAPDKLVELSWQNICLEHQRYLERSSLFALPENGAQVIITGFVSPHRFYIKECAPAKQAEYAQVVQKINTLGAKQPRIMRFPERFEYALHNWQGLIKRVQILEILHPNHVRMHLIDEGRASIGRLTEMLEISDEINSLPRCAPPLQLHGVENYMMGERLQKFMRKFLSQRCTLQLPGPERSLTGAVLKSNWTRKIINEEITEFCRGELILNSSVRDPHCMLKFEQHERIVTSQDLEQLYPTEADAVVHLPTDWNVKEEIDADEIEEQGPMECTEDVDSIMETDV